MRRDTRVKLGMTPEEVVEIFGAPDSVTDRDYKTQWEWERLTDEDSEMQVSIEFMDGLVQSVSIFGQQRTHG